jgi:hypothetical protein
MQEDSVKAAKNDKKNRWRFTSWGGEIEDLDIVSKFSKKWNSHCFLYSLLIIVNSLFFLANSLILSVMNT